MQNNLKKQNQYQSCEPIFPIPIKQKKTSGTSDSVYYNHSEEEINNQSNSRTSKQQNNKKNQDSQTSCQNPKPYYHANNVINTTQAN